MALASPASIPPSRQMPHSHCQSSRQHGIWQHHCHHKVRFRHNNQTAAPWPLRYLLLFPLVSTPRPQSPSQSQTPHTLTTPVIPRCFLHHDTHDMTWMATRPLSHSTSRSTTIPTLHLLAKIGRRLKLARILLTRNIVPTELPAFPASHHPAAGPFHHVIELSNVDRCLCHDYHHYRGWFPSNAVHMFAPVATCLAHQVPEAQTPTTFSTSDAMSAYVDVNVAGSSQR
jgi:hypothetical protein